jgi:acyl-coenzyme A thioesterase PaaI-like protein
VSEDDLKELFSHWSAVNMEATGAWAERRRLAANMRRVIERLVEIDPPIEELSTAADALERYAERLERHPRNRKYEGFAETSNAGDVAALFDQSPVIGLSNPLSPPIQLAGDHETKTVEGTGTFGSAFEGPPGCVHGGFVAAAIDETLGFANSLSGAPGMTACLKINFRRPTPLHTPLNLKARLDRIDGRKVYTSGEIYARGVLTADAEGLFISISFDKFHQLREARQGRETSRSE